MTVFLVARAHKVSPSLLFRWRRLASVRSHLQSLSPLPKYELLAFRRALSELGALTRELHRIAHAFGQGGQAAARPRAA
jgi:transposase-like protein